MTMLQEGKVVGVLRKCRVCGVWKSMQHYFVYDTHGQPIDSKKVCAACRGRGRQAAS